MKNGVEKIDIEREYNPSGTLDHESIWFGEILVQRFVDEKGETDFICVSLPADGKELRYYISANGQFGFYQNSINGESHRSDLTIEDIDKSLDVLAALRIVNSIK